MGGLFADSENSVLSLVIGMIVLIGVALGLGMMMNRGSSGGDQRSPEQIELDTLGVKMSALEADMAALDQKMAENFRLAGLEAEVDELELKLTSKLDEQEALVRKSHEKIQETTDIREQWLEYRNRRKVKLRAAGIGRELGTYTLNNGKAYQEAVVTGVDDLGLKIRHTSGTARIPVKDLSAALRADYDLDLAAAEAALKAQREEEKKRFEAEEQRLKKKREAEMAKLKKRRTQRGRSDEPESTAEVDLEKLGKIRKLKYQAQSLRRRYYELNSELNQARADSRGSRRSPPGSLQTWEERIASIIAKQKKVRTQIHMTDAELSVLDPKYRVIPVD